MPQTVVARTEDIAPGKSIAVKANGRDIAVFNVNGEFFAMANRCPHEGAPLCKGVLVGLVESDEPGEYRMSRHGELLRCPWHGWEFDVRTGQSWCDPQRIRVKNYSVSVASGSELVEGPYKVEIFPISVEDEYIVVET